MSVASSSLRGVEKMDRLPIHQYIDMSLYVWWHYFADEESHGMERNTDLRQTGEQQVGESRECGGGRQGDHPGQHHVANGAPADGIETLEQADADDG